MKCHLFKVFPFGNLRELLQCFSFARLKRTIFWRFKYVILTKLQDFSFREIEMCHFREIEISHPDIKIFEIL